MKVVHIGFQYGLNNTGGAAIAATRLHLALLDSGIESHYVCVQKGEEGPNVHVLPRRGAARLLYCVLTKLTRCIWKFLPCRKSICLNVIPMFGLERLLKRIEPDVVHVQWVNADVCAFEQLGKLPYKLILNLHDLSMINAIAPYPGPDIRYQNGFTPANSTRLERWLLRRKRMLVERKRPVFIGPSEWVCRMCSCSLVGRGCSAFPILNIIDARFRFDSVAHMHHDKMTMLFGAFGGRRNVLKGWSDCERALRLLPQDVKNNSVVHIFGETAADYDIDGLPIRFLGEQSNPEDLRRIYSSADVFLFPSVEETQGMTKIEALLCGLPVVAFDRAACAEGIIHGRTGWIAADGDLAGFAAGVQYYYKLHRHGEMHAVHVDIAQSSNAVFATGRIVDNIRSVYQLLAGAD